MSLYVAGKNKISGVISINGAKNSALPIMAATAMLDEPLVLHNIPDISDIKLMQDILAQCGGFSERIESHTLRINNKYLDKPYADYSLVSKMRASFFLLGPLLTRFNSVKISRPGGCNIGTRDIDIHLSGLEKLGVTIVQEAGYIIATRDKLKGTKIHLDYPSVGATENIMMAAVCAKGKTTITNAAQEPEIVDLANFLNACGANVTGAGTDTVIIQCTPKLTPPQSYAIIGDRIEAGTYLLAAAITRGNLTVEGIDPSFLLPVLDKLADVGFEITSLNNSITLNTPSSAVLKPVDIKTGPHPSFPTDLQAPFMSLLATIQGTSTICDTVFQTRFSHINELNRMGADIILEGNLSVIKGVPSLQGAQVSATDLRAGAALILAALGASGTTQIDNEQFIDRGYENVEGRLKKLGANIYRKETETSSIKL